nr:MAG TPA: hypothetical protein [Caudoviricetes sp.]
MVPKSVPWKLLPFDAMLYGPEFLYTAAFTLLPFN